MSLENYCEYGISIAAVAVTTASIGPHVATIGTINKYSVMLPF